MKFRSFGFSALGIYSLGAKPGSDLPGVKFLSFDLVSELEMLYFFILSKSPSYYLFHSQFWYCLFYLPFKCVTSAIWAQSEIRPDICSSVFCFHAGSYPSVGGGERGLKKDKWLTPLVLLVAEEQIVEYKAMPSKCDMWWPWFLFLVGLFFWVRACHSAVGAPKGPPNSWKCTVLQTKENRFKVVAQDWRITGEQAEHCRFPGSQSQGVHSLWQYSLTGILASGLFLDFGIM